MNIDPASIPFSFPYFKLWKMSTSGSWQSLLPLSEMVIAALLSQTCYPEDPGSSFYLILTAVDVYLTLKRPKSDSLKVFLKNNLTLFKTFLPSLLRMC